MEVNWKSIGGQLEVNWKSIGSQLEVNWKSIGGQLEVNIQEATKAAMVPVVSLTSLAIGTHSAHSAKRFQEGELWQLNGTRQSMENIARIALSGPFRWVK